MAATDTPFHCFGNVLVEPGATLDKFGEVDVVVVCDAYTPIDTRPRNCYEQEIDWLQP